MYIKNIMEEFYLIKYGGIGPCGFWYIFLLDICILGIVLPIFLNGMEDIGLRGFGLWVLWLILLANLHCGASSVKYYLKWMIPMNLVLGIIYFMILAAPAPRRRHPLNSPK
tara:strand:- start:255 stop:587 length:333 start_codon:yes stop_codon:yes gene_type:complete